MLRDIVHDTWSGMLDGYLRANKWKKKRSGNACCVEGAVSLAGAHRPVVGDSLILQRPFKDQ